MSGVRFISILTAVVAIFLWAGFVVNTWQKNKAQRLAAASGQQTEKAAALAEKKSAHDRADEMAAAASEEFQKISDELLAKDKAGLQVAGDETAKDAGKTAEKPDVKPEVKIVLKPQDKKILTPKNLPQRKLEEPQLIAEASPETKKDAGKELAGAAPQEKVAPEVEVKVAGAKEGEAKLADTKEAETPELEVAEAANTPLKTEGTPSEKSAEDGLPESQEPPVVPVETARKDEANEKVEADINKKAEAESKDKTTSEHKGEAQLAAAAPEKKPVWVVPDGADPQYDESKAYKVGDLPWKVPTGNDPIDLKVATKITKMAETVKDGAEVAAETVGEKVSDIAGDVKDTIVSAKKWVVPTGNDPEYPGRDVVEDGGPVWRVPDGVTPQYADAATPDKPELAGTDVKEDKLAMKDSVKSIPIISYLMPEVKDDEDVVTNKIENRLKDDSASRLPVIQKDMARLSKDLKAVPVAKYAEGHVKEELALGASGDHDANEAKKTGKLSNEVEAKFEGADEAADKEPLNQDPEQPETAKLETKKVDTARLETPEKVAKAEEAPTAKVVEKPAKKAVKAKTKKPTLEQQLEKIKQADKAFVAERDEKAAKDKLAAVEDTKRADKAASDEKPVDTAAVADRPADKVGKAALESADESQKAALEDKGKLQARMDNEKKPVWTVPTGNDPQVGVVAQLERGIETVKDAAVEAGSELAETVAKIPNNVKEAVASEQKWEIPTGVTWGEDEKATEVKDETKLAAKPAQKSELKVAAVETKKVETKKVETLKAEKPAGQKSADDGADNKANNDKKEIVTAYVPLPKKSEVPLPQKKLLSKEEQAALDKRMFVSANLKRSEDEIVIAVGEADDKSLKAERDDKSGLVTKVIDYFSDKGKGSNKAPEQMMSALEKARFGAIKELMLDRVDYKFTDIKKGEGEINITGRGQVGAVLALYIGPRYLGDVKTDAKGEWEFNRQVFLPKGQHIVQAQQMSKSGLVLARKTMPYVQKIAANAPEGYEEDSIGLALGDKALAIMKKKLKKDGGKAGKLNTVDVPLPKRKIVDGGKTAAEKTDGKAKDVEVAALEKSKTAKTGDEEASKGNALSKEKSPEKAETEKAKLVPDDEAKLVKDTAKLDAPADRTHYIVKPGDTLSLIAQKVYGDALRYKEIMKLNPKLKDAARIYPKQKLLVKSAEVAETASPVEVAAVAGKGAKGVTLPQKKPEDMAEQAKEKSAKKADEAAKKADSPEADFYTVKKGDSLWIIAKKVYGNGARYQELIKLNPALNDNPTLIRPDLKLKVRAS